MQVVKRHLTVVLVSLFFLVVAITYHLLIPAKYEVSARVVIHRDQLETPSFSPESSKNRWIWVRDGYAIKESLTSLPFLTSLVDANDVLQGRLEIARAKYATSGASDEDIKNDFVAEMRKQISVDYLGGDSFTYVLKVKEQDPLLGKQITNALIERLRFLTVIETQASYRDSLAALKKEMAKNLPVDVEAHLADTYRSLLASRILFDAGASRRLEVVESPSVPLSPAWPKLDRLLVLALLLGLALGLLLEYAMALPKTQRLRTV